LDVALFRTMEQGTNADLEKVLSRPEFRNDLQNFLVKHLSVPTEYITLPKDLVRVAGDIRNLKTKHEGIEEKSRVTGFSLPYSIENMVPTIPALHKIFLPKASDASFAKRAIVREAISARYVRECLDQSGLAYSIPQVIHYGGEDLVRLYLSGLTLRHVLTDIHAFARAGSEADKREAPLLTHLLASNLMHYLAISHFKINDPRNVESLPQSGQVIEYGSKVFMPKLPITNNAVQRTIQYANTIRNAWVKSKEEIDNVKWEDMLAEAYTRSRIAAIEKDELSQLALLDFNPDNVILLLDNEKDVNIVQFLREKDIVDSLSKRFGYIDLEKFGHGSPIYDTCIVDHPLLALTDEQIDNNLSRYVSTFNGLCVKEQALDRKVKKEIFEEKFKYLRLERLLFAAANDPDYINVRIMLENLNRRMRELPDLEPLRTALAYGIPQLREEPAR